MTTGDIPPARHVAATKTMTTAAATRHAGAVVKATEVGSATPKVTRRPRNAAGMIAARHASRATAMTMIAGQCAVAADAIKAMAVGSAIPKVIPKRRSAAGMSAATRVRRRANMITTIVAIRREVAA